MEGIGHDQDHIGRSHADRLAIIMYVAVHVSILVQMSVEPTHCARRLGRCAEVRNEVRSLAPFDARKESEHVFETIPKAAIHPDVNQRVVTGASNWIGLAVGAMGTDHLLLTVT